jgi:hypothetical protein
MGTALAEPTRLCLFGGHGGLDARPAASIVRSTDMTGFVLDQIDARRT